MLLAGGVLGRHEADAEKGLHVALDEHLERPLQGEGRTLQFDGGPVIDAEELEITHQTSSSTGLRPALASSPRKAFARTACELRLIRCVARPIRLSRLSVRESN